MSLLSDHSPDRDGQPPHKGMLGVGLGAGLIGAFVLGLRYLIRPATKAPIPEIISPLSFRTQEFQSGHGQMIYHENGSGPQPTLVFVHDLGVGASSYEWSKVYATFAGSRRVLAPDLLGFGESERSHAKFSAADYAASLAHFIEELCSGEPHPPILIASGLGAGFAALMASQHPDLVSRLILWMPTGKAETSWRLNLGSRLPTINRFLYRNLLARRGAIRKILAARGSGNTNSIPQEAIEVYALCAKQYQAEYSVYRWLQHRVDTDFEGSLAELKPPVALLWAGRVSSKSANYGAQLANANRRCVLRIVPEAGPNALLEKPEMIAAALQEELQSELRVLKAAS